MENPNCGHESHQPSGQQNIISSTSLADVVPGNHMNGSGQVNSPTVAFLEQHRLHLDRVLQTHMSLQNTTLSTIMDSMIKDAVKEKDEEIAHLHIALNQVQDFIRNLEQTIDDAIRFARQSILYVNWLLPKLDDSGSSGSSNEVDHTGSNQEVEIDEMNAVETTHPSLICKVCNSHSACMLILPCHHLCVCNSCGTHLTTCPICNSAKEGLLEARFS
uniref:RING-type domain-containing protein n=1 Tax=Oryza brachyantha TaxID=4533 RepID=J3MJZ2_ORYBR